MLFKVKGGAACIVLWEMNIRKIHYFLYLTERAAMSINDQLFYKEVL